MRASYRKWCIMGGMFIDLCVLSPKLSFQFFMCWWLHRRWADGCKQRRSCRTHVKDVINVIAVLCAAGRPDRYGSCELRGCVYAHTIQKLQPVWCVTYIRPSACCWTSPSMMSDAQLSQPISFHRPEVARCVCHGEFILLPSGTLLWEWVYTVRICGTFLKPSCLEKHNVGDCL